MDDIEWIGRFFINFELPSLDHSDISALEGIKTALEIDSAIKKQIWKSVRSRWFSAKLASLLSKVSKEVLVSKSLPGTMTQGTISVLLKKDKDPLKCASYHPIS